MKRGCKRSKWLTPVAPARSKSLSKPQSPTRPFAYSQVSKRQPITLKLASDTLRPLIRPFVLSLDACCTGERFPRPRGREADTNSRPATGCTPTVGTLDSQVAMLSFILNLSRP
jgi:hypothetical protein